MCHAHAPQIFSVLHEAQVILTTSLYRQRMDYITMISPTHFLGKEVDILLVSSRWSIEQLNQCQCLCSSCDWDHKGRDTGTTQVYQTTLKCKTWANDHCRANNRYMYVVHNKIFKQLQHLSILCISTAWTTYTCTSLRLGRGFQNVWTEQFFI